MVKFERHIESDRRVQAANEAEMGRVEFDASAVVGGNVLQLQMAKRPKEKGMGPALIAGEACSCVHKAMARLYDPIALKATAAFEPPLQWRGGDIVTIPKGLTAKASEWTSRREIWLCDDVGKAVGAYGRGDLFKGVQHTLVNSQCGGGFGGRGCDVTHAMIRAARDAAEASSRSIGLLFVDIKSAYASMKRCLVFRRPEEDAQWAKFLVEMGYTEHQAAAIVADVAKLNAWGQSSAHSVAVVDAMHRSVWAAFDGNDHVLATAQGSQAGIPYADLVFMVAVARVTVYIQDELRMCGLMETWQTGAAKFLYGVKPDAVDSLELSEIGIIDDAAYPVVAPADQLIDKVAKVMQIVYRGYAAHGFELNLKPTKTAVLLALASHTKVGVRWRLASAARAICESTTSRGRRLTVVSPSSLRTIGARKAVPKFATARL